MFQNNSPGKIALNKLFKNKPAMLGLIIILLAVFISLLGANLRKDKTEMANEMMLPIASKPPGFMVKTLLINKGKEVEEKNFFEKMLFGSQENENRIVPINSYRYKDDKLIYKEYDDNDTISLPEKTINLSEIVYGTNTSSYNSTNQQISFKDSKGNIITHTREELTEIVEKQHINTDTYLLGTDKYGRDMLSRLLAGTVVSLSVGLIAVLVSLLIGIVMGALAGYFGGKTDAVISWLVNVIWSVPTLLLVISITLLLGKGFSQIFIAVGLTMWVEVARITRGQFLSLREKEFVEAARALGFPTWRIIFKHILPNTWSPLIVISASNFASAILIEAGLSFLGVGAQPPMPSWGNMIKEHYGYIVLDKAYLAIIPGVAIMLLVLSFTLLGNGLRDALDTRSTN